MRRTENMHHIYSGGKGGGGGGGVNIRESYKGIGLIAMFSSSYISRGTNTIAKSISCTKDVHLVNQRGNILN